MGFWNTAQDGGVECVPFYRNFSLKVCHFVPFRATLLVIVKLGEGWGLTTEITEDTERGDWGAGVQPGIFCICNIS